MASDKDLYIFYGSLEGDDYIQCYCSQWDSSNYSVVLRTWLTKGEVTTLRDNLVPGAVGELYQILGKPTYYDKTWEGGNTLRLVPNSGSLFTSDLRLKYDDILIYVKNLTVQPVEGQKTYLDVKIEGYISGSL